MKTVLFLFVFAVLLLTTIYLYLRHPFWIRQPVLKPHEFWRWMVPRDPFLLQTGLAPPTKYTRPDQITTWPYHAMSRNEKRRLARCLQYYYLTSEDILCGWTRRRLDIYMRGSAPAFASCAHNGKGCLVSKTVDFVFQNRLRASLCSWDLLATSEKHTDMARELIQTLESEQRRHGGPRASLFRQDGLLCEGIVPLVSFSLHTLRVSDLLLNHSKTLLLTRMNTREHRAFLLDWLTHVVPRSYEVSVIGNVVPQLEQTHDAGTGLMFVYFVRDRRTRQDLGAFFFKDACLLYEQSGARTLHLVASHRLTPDPPAFFAGLQACLSDLVTYEPTFQMLLLDALSSNLALLPFCPPTAPQKSAFYLYNYILPSSPLPPERVFVVL